MERAQLQQPHKGLHFDLCMVLRLWVLYKNDSLIETASDHHPIKASRWFSMFIKFTHMKKKDFFFHFWVLKVQWLNTTLITLKCCRVSRTFRTCTEFHLTNKNKSLGSHFLTRRGVIGYIPIFWFNSPLFLVWTAGTAQLIRMQPWSNLLFRQVGESSHLLLSLRCQSESTTTLKIPQQKWHDNMYPPRYDQRAWWWSAQELWW